MSAVVAERQRRAVGDRAGDAQTAAEVALVALSLATAFGFCRLFIGWSWFPTLALAAVASHLLAICCRRRGPRAGAVVAGVAGRPGPVHQPRLLPRHERLRPAHPSDLAR